MQGISFKGWYAVPSNNGAFDTKTRQFMLDTLSYRDTTNDSFNNKKDYFVCINKEDEKAFEKAAIRSNILNMRRVSKLEVFERNIRLIKPKSSLFALTTNLYKKIRNGIKFDITHLKNMVFVELKKGNNQKEFYEFNEGLLVRRDYSRDGMDITEFFDKTTGGREKMIYKQGPKTVCEKTFDTGTGVCVEKVLYNTSKKDWRQDNYWTSMTYKYDPETGKEIGKFKAPIFTA